MESVLLCNDIYRILEGEIVSLKMRPGETLSGNNLCKRFSASRTPIQSVSQRFQQNRFVQIIPHKKTVVTPIDLGIASQLIYQRVVMETTILRDFVKTCTSADVARVRCTMQLLEEAMADVAESGHFDINNFSNENLEMHRIWFRATNKMFLWEALIRPQPGYSRSIHLDIMGVRNVPSALSGHERMIEVIDSRDVDAIEGIMTHYLLDGMRRLGEQLSSEEYRDFFLQKSP